MFRKILKATMIIYVVLLVFVMLSITVNHHAETQLAESFCWSCDGSGRCKTCDGYGRCQTCDGSGRCKTCDGMGWIRNEFYFNPEDPGAPIPEEICIDCYGTGNCKDCDYGSGKCKICDGLGTCPDCYGTGVIN